MRKILYLNILHFINDGFQASFLLLLPFIAKDLHINFTQVGMLGTVLSASGLLLALPAGHISHRFGGLKTLIFALFLYGLAFFITGFVIHYLWLVIMFVVAGVGFGLFAPISFALMAKWTEKSSRGRAIGNFSASGEMGKIAISTLLSFIVVTIGWNKTAQIYGVVALTCSIFFYILLKANFPTYTVKDRLINPSKYSHILRNKLFLLATLTSTLDVFASASLYIFLPFLLLKRGVEPIYLGVFTATFFMGSIAGKSLLGRLVDRKGNIKVLIASELFMAIFILLLAHTTSFILLIFSSFALGIFTKGTVPAVQTMVSDSIIEDNHLEHTFSINSFNAYIAVTIAPILFGVISDKGGITQSFNIMALAAVLTIIPAYIFYAMRNNIATVI